MNPISREWLRAAKDDLVLIEQISQEVRLTHLAAFHAQQAIEKSLKALVESRGERVPKTHSLNRLLGVSSLPLEEAEADLIHLLDELYIEARYPGDLGLLPNGKPTIADVQLFFDLAVRIYETISQGVAP